MKNKRHYLSLSLIGLLLYGIAAGTFHQHDHGVDLGPTEHETIAKDHHFCALCASHIQSDIEGTTEVNVFFPHYIEVYNFSELVISDPLFSIQNYRAPPFLS